MLHLGGGLKAPQYHVVICVVPKVPDEYITEQTVVYPEDVVHPGLHLLDMFLHAPGPAVLHP